MSEFKVGSNFDNIVGRMDKALFPPRTVKFASCCLNFSYWCLSTICLKLNGAICTILSGKNLEIYGKGRRSWRCIFKDGLGSSFSSGLVIISTAKILGHLLEAASTISRQGKRQKGTDHFCSWHITLTCYIKWYFLVLAFKNGNV